MYLYASMTLFTFVCWCAGGVYTNVYAGVAICMFVFLCGLGVATFVVWRCGHPRKPRLLRCATVPLADHVREHWE